MCWSNKDIFSEQERLKGQVFWKILIVLEVWCISASLIIINFNISIFPASWVWWYFIMQGSTQLSPQVDMYVIHQSMLVGKTMHCRPGALPGRLGLPNIHILFIIQYQHRKYCWNVQTYQCVRHMILWMYPKARQHFWSYGIWYPTYVHVDELWKQAIFMC